MSPDEHKAILRASCEMTDQELEAARRRMSGDQARRRSA